MRHLVLIVLLLMMPATHAEDRLLLYGAELSPESRYFYLGTIVPIRTDESTWFIRLWSDTQMYEYENDIQTSDVDSDSLQLSLGRQLLHDNGWINLYLGYAVSHTVTDPDDPGNESAGRHKQGVISFDGEYRMKDCDHNLIYGASYLFDREAYWLRIRPICWSLDDAGLGYEVVNHGDNSYNHTQLGVVYYNKALTESTHYTLKGGVTFTRDSDAFPYIGIEFTTQY